MLGRQLGRATALVAALGVSWAASAEAAPDAGAQNVEACLRGCDASETDTDRATCRITCEERQNAKEQPDVVRWTTEELKGGSPDPNVERGRKTTYVETSPSGTRTRVEADPGRRRSSTPPPAVRRPVPPTVVYRQCLGRCESRFSLGDRAVCHLGCAEREFRRLQQQSRPPARTTPASRPPAATASPPTGSSRRDPGCVSACVEAGATCARECRGEDRSTCELQCDATAAACERKC